MCIGSIVELIKHDQRHSRTDERSFFFLFFFCFFLDDSSSGYFCCSSGYRRMKYDRLYLAIQTRFSPNFSFFLYIVVVVHFFEMEDTSSYYPKVAAMTMTAFDCKKSTVTGGFTITYQPEEEEDCRRIVPSPVYDAMRRSRTYDRQRIHRFFFFSLYLIECVQRKTKKLQVGRQEN